MLWIREISICLINFFFLVSLRIIPAESNRSRVFSCRCWTAASKYTFNYPWLIRDTVLFFFFFLSFGTIFTAIKTRASRCWLVPMTLETRATFNRVCRAIRRGRFARWLNDLGTAHCSLRFLIINLNVLNSIFLRVFSPFLFGFSFVIIEISSRLFKLATRNR